MFKWKSKSTRVTLLIGLISIALLLIFGYWFGPWFLVAVAVVVAGCVALGFRLKLIGRQQLREVAARTPSPTQSPSVAQTAPIPESREAVGLVDEMIAQGRHALLLRHQISDNLEPAQIARAMAALDEASSIVPAGAVCLQGHFFDPSDHEQDTPSINETLVQVEALYLDRYLVSNRAYYEFVAAGGYQQMSLWDASAWSAVLDFVDRTGFPGPRFWEQGVYPAGLEDHPVVGVCWYEADAFARWAGKRLPSDPEWVKAGCWPVSGAGSKPLQRKFPWGDSMDRRRANLWRWPKAHTSPVTDYADGASVGGIYQLIGNVWEWTSTDFGAWDKGHQLKLSVPMKSIRGGAFDTYFDSQASCQFQSGESLVARKHNIGFRCALSICDVIELNRVSDVGQENASLAATTAPCETSP